MTNEELWQAALGEIELSISKANFVTWFKNTTILSNEGGRVIIGVPNGFAKEWLENKYYAYVLRSLRNLQQDIKEVSCAVYNFQGTSQSPVKNVDAVQIPKQSKRMSASLSDSYDIHQDSSLNPRYLFENFIIGESNELARAACYAVSQNLGRAYNPLFIYGGVGLGKTHLLQSIGNEIIKKDDHKKIKYITSERFANELIESIKNQSIAQFKADYQKIDLLIIDDIQFLSGKEKTQNEFFHIFNVLYQINKQIVISSDRPPKAIPTIEERLRSRFEGGMIADIGKPDLETRMAILKAKSAERDIYLDDETIRFVAENIKSNIRELEGALNRIIAISEFNKKPPSLKFVRQSLSEIITSGKKKGVQHKHIIDAVSEFYGIDDKKLIIKGRKKEIARARQVAMYLMRSELNTSYPSIGERFGGRNHTTALHAFDKISREVEENEKLKEEIEIIKERIYNI
ncbi:MAG: chromosomal replication initiator protein DnaA [Candidatus Moranbacteria bacterium]|nr:chromosomal replication initiator protein DnaA [Candidatus Moranbacteria bacterium]